jgi:hypothetical protein
MTATEHAISLLRQCQNLTTPDQAIDYLRERFTRYRLLSLYQHFFPKECADSQASPYPAIEATEECYTPKEWEFLMLVNAHLFPLPYLDYYKEDYPVWNLSSVLITSMGLGWLDEEGLEYLSPGWQALLPLSYTGRAYLEEYGLWGVEWYEGLFDEPIDLDTIASPHTINYRQLRQDCHDKGHPFRFFPLALKLIDFDTGNPWLDETTRWTNSYYTTSLIWSKANVTYLKRKFDQAERLLQASNDLIIWLETDLTTRFMELLSLWNHASMTHNSSLR